jgi:hypothetical protein
MRNKITFLLITILMLNSCKSVKIDSNIITKNINTVRNETSTFDEYRKINLEECTTTYLKRFYALFDCYITVHNSRKYLVIDQKIQFEIK